MLFYLADAVIDLSDDITTLVKCYEGGEVGAFKFCIQLQPEMRTGSKGMVLGNPGVFDPGGGHIHTGPECKTGLSDRTKAPRQQVSRNMICFLVMSKQPNV